MTYVAEEPMTTDRARQGWLPPAVEAVRLEQASSDAVVRYLVHSVPENSIHICHGLRANGRIAVAQRALTQRGLEQWLVMETVDNTGWLGIAKRLEYARLFKRWRDILSGVLAIGHRTHGLVTARGMPVSKVYPFTYSLSQPDGVRSASLRSEGRFRFIYVGQLVRIKRVDLLLRALAALDRQDIELNVLGSGPLNEQLKAMARDLMPGRFHLLGVLPHDKVSAAIARADCLVLPSRYDCWGVVVSEALLVGTPAICSDACGSAGVVRASGVGCVISSGSQSEVESSAGTDGEGGSFSASAPKPGGEFCLMSGATSRCPISSTGPVALRRRCAKATSILGTAQLCGAA